jgi:hypothetical protein
MRTIIQISSSLLAFACLTALGMAATTIASSYPYPVSRIGATFEGSGVDPLTGLHIET